VSVFGYCWYESVVIVVDVDDLVVLLVWYEVVVWGWVLFGCGLVEIDVVGGGLVMCWYLVVCDDVGMVWGWVSVYDCVVGWVVVGVVVDLELDVDVVFGVVG